MRYQLALLLIACTLGGLAAAVPTGHTTPPCWARHQVCQPTTATATSASSSTATTTTSAGATTAASVAYLFDDEFSGAADAPPDAAKWWATPWCSTASDDAEGCYNAANAFTDGQGHLVLRVSPGTMGRPYDMARIQTFQEGGWPPPKVLWSSAPPIRVEYRAKFAAGAGLWEGVWAQGTNSATPIELDVEEFRGAVPSTDTCHVHVTSEWGASIDVGSDLSAGWHDYWMDYYPDHTVFGVDGATCGSTTTAAQSIGVRLSNAVGVPGTWGGQGGPPPASTIPADMLVDYVRVSQLSP